MYKTFVNLSLHCPFLIFPFFWKGNFNFSLKFTKKDSNALNVVLYNPPRQTNLHSAKSIHFAVIFALLLLPFYCCWDQWQRITNIPHHIVERIELLWSITCHNPVLTRRQIIRQSTKNGLRATDKFARTTTGQAWN